MTFSYSCQKEGKEIITTINGQLRTNGTENVIKDINGLQKPRVTIYHRLDIKSSYEVGFEEVAHTTINEYGDFSITIDLRSQGDYFIGISELNKSLYFEYLAIEWRKYCIDDNSIEKISVGGDNNYIIYIDPISYVKPRFINTNPDTNNLDVFKCFNGFSCDTCSYNDLRPIFYGHIDSTLTWIGKTWGGTESYKGLHKMDAQLTRNNITKDTSIFFSVLPFDTTIIEIRY